MKKTKVFSGTVAACEYIFVHSIFFILFFPSHSFVHTLFWCTKIVVNIKNVTWTIFFLPSYLKKSLHALFIGKLQLLLLFIIPAIAFQWVLSFDWCAQLCTDNNTHDDHDNSEKFRKISGPAQFCKLVIYIHSYTLSRFDNPLRSISHSVCFSQSLTQLHWRLPRRGTCYLHARAHASGLW